MTSVASRNIFDILADVEDQPQETASELSKEEIVVSKKVDRSRASKTEARIRHEYPQRGGAPRAAASTRGNDEARSGPRDRNVGPRLSGRRNQEDGNGGSDYPPRNARGARAGERSRGGGRGGRRGREYDRHSGTGREESGKKDSQAWGDPTSPWPSESNDAGAAEQTSWTANDDSANGGGTWGAENEAPVSNEAGGWNEGEDAAKDDNVWNPGSSLDDLSTTDNVVDWKSGEKDKEDDGGYSIDAVQAPVEIVQKTLDEYLAERAQRGLGVTLPEPRQPNEGADDSQWKDAVPLERPDEEDVLFAGKETSYKLKSKDKPKKKEYIEIEQAFERTSSGPQRGRGRGRGGREGNRERRDNRDGHRENRRGRSDNVNLDDKRDFPSLGTA